MRDLQENAGPVSGVWFGATGAAMLEIQEHLNALFDNPVRTTAFDVNDEADTARVMLVSRVV